MSPRFYSIQCITTFEHNVCSMRACFCPCHRTVGINWRCSEGRHDECPGKRDFDEMTLLPAGSMRMFTFLNLVCDCVCHVNEARDHLLELRRRQREV